MTLKERLVLRCRLVGTGSCVAVVVKESPLSKKARLQELISHNLALVYCLLNGNIAVVKCSVLDVCSEGSVLGSSIRDAGFGFSLCFYLWLIHAQV